MLRPCTPGPYKAQCVCVHVCGVLSVCKAGLRVCAHVHRLGGPDRERLSAHVGRDVRLKDSGVTGKCSVWSVAGGDSRAQRTRTTSRCTVGALRGALSTGDRPGRLSSGQPVTSLVTGADPCAPTPLSTCPLCRSVSCAVVLLFPQPGLSSRPWL